MSDGFGFDSARLGLAEDGRIALTVQGCPAMLMSRRAALNFAKKLRAGAAIDPALGKLADDIVKLATMPQVSSDAD